MRVGWSIASHLGLPEAYAIVFGGVSRTQGLGVGSDRGKDGTAIRPESRQELRRARTEAVLLVAVLSARLLAAVAQGWQGHGQDS